MERGSHEYRKNKFTFFGKMLYFSYAFAFYLDGDGMQMYARWWHPLSWVLIPILFLLSAIVYGIPYACQYKHEIGIGIKPWFKEHPDRFERWYWNEKTNSTTD